MKSAFEIKLTIKIDNENMFRIERLAQELQAVSAISEEDLEFCLDCIECSKLIKK